MIRRISISFAWFPLSGIFRADEIFYLSIETSSNLKLTSQRGNFVSAENFSLWKPSLCLMCSQVELISKRLRKKFVRVVEIGIYHRLISIRRDFPARTMFFLCFFPNSSIRKFMTFCPIGKFRLMEIKPYELSTETN